MQCPSRDEYADCLLGRIPDAQAALLLEHAEQCARCGEVVAMLDETTDGLTESLRDGSGSVLLTPECRRMMSQAETFVSAELPDEKPAVDLSSRHLLQGMLIRDYEIGQKLGEGGMGTVFVARHQRLGRNVALKVLSLRRAADVDAQRRFEQEMAIVGRLHHPGIVGALDAGEQDGVQYLVMELIDGVNLVQLIESLGQIPLAGPTIATS